jgi:hypothetical protein
VPCRTNFLGFRKLKTSKYLIVIIIYILSSVSYFEYDERFGNRGSGIHRQPSGGQTTEFRLGSDRH